MKRILPLFFAILFALLMTSCGKEKATVLVDNSENSVFEDFYTEGSSVYIDCTLNIYSDSDCTVSLTAVDNEDVEIGLLKSNLLVGQTQDGQTDFALKKGENSVRVLFRGDYAGVYQITRREIPRFISIEVQ